MATKVETTKKLASLRQIRAAIGHFELKQYECGDARGRR